MTAQEILADLREWAEPRFRVACDLVRSSPVERERWLRRGHANELRDLLHHLDSLDAKGGTDD